MSIQTDAPECESATLMLPTSVGNWSQQYADVECGSDGIRTLWACYYLLDGRDVLYELYASKSPLTGAFTYNVHEVTGNKQSIDRDDRTKHSVFSGEFSEWPDCRDQIIALMEQDEVTP
jgi:hypothetical protein